MVDILGLRGCKGFSPAAWSNSSLNERLWSLQVAEMELAKEQGRPPCDVELNADLKPRVYGRYDGGSTIEINPIILGASPHAAINTLGHEAEHAYQVDVRWHPDKHLELSPEKAAEIRDGIINYKSVAKHGYTIYSTQMVEVEADKAGARLEAQLPSYQAYEVVKTDANSSSQSADDFGEAFQSAKRTEIMKRFEKSAVPQAPLKPTDSQSQGFSR